MHTHTHTHAHLTHRQGLHCHAHHLHPAERWLLCGPVHLAPPAQHPRAHPRARQAHQQAGVVGAGSLGALVEEVGGGEGRWTDGWRSRPSLLGVWLGLVGRSRLLGGRVRALVCVLAFIVAHACPNTTPPAFGDLEESAWLCPVRTNSGSPREPASPWLTPDAAARAPWSGRAWSPPAKVHMVTHHHHRGGWWRLRRPPPCVRLHPPRRGTAPRQCMARHGSRPPRRAPLLPAWRHFVFCLLHCRQALEELEAQHADLIARRQKAEAGRLSHFEAFTALTFRWGSGNPKLHALAFAR